jgi:hypothetical protein
MDSLDFVDQMVHHVVLLRVLLCHGLPSLSVSAWQIKTGSFSVFCRLKIFGFVWWRADSSRGTEETTGEWELINISKNYGERSKVMSFVSCYVFGMPYFPLSFNSRIDSNDFLLIQ